MTKTPESAMVWGKIWDERGSAYPEDDPVKIDGFDQVFGEMDEKTVSNIVDDIKEKLQLNKSDILFELGCGVGLLLSRLTPFVLDSFGTDLSENMVNRAKKIYPHLKIERADSTSLPFGDNSVSKILVHSVFQYFPDYGYAFDVIDELKRITRPKGVIMVSDIMDIEKKDLYLSMRKSALDKVVWKSSVKADPEHLYYPKSSFCHYAQSRKMKIIIIDRKIDGYLNADYRHDVLLVKND